MGRGRQGKWDPQRETWLLMVAGHTEEGCLGVYHSLLIVQSWDVPAHKPLFVSFSQNRAFDQSRLFDWGSISDVLGFPNSGQMAFQKE